MRVLILKEKHEEHSMPEDRGLRAARDSLWLDYTAWLRVSDRGSASRG